MNGDFKSLKKAFKAVSSFNKSGKLSIQTDKPYYVGGELVTGRIYALIHSPIQATSIVFKVKGFERSEINRKQYRSERIYPGDHDYRPPQPGQPETVQHRSIPYIQQYRSLKEFFKVKLPIFNMNGGILQPGQYTWPFQYQLPADLPGSFYERRTLYEHIDEYHKDEHLPDKEFYDSDDENGDGQIDNADSDSSDDDDNKRQFRRNKYNRPAYYGLINYVFSARLDVQGFLSKDLKALQPVIIHPRLGVDVKPATASESATVCLCCCIPRGKVHMNCYFDKNAYAPGEMATIKADINNESKSTMHMVVKLIRHITVNAGRTASTFSEVVNHRKYDDVPPQIRKTVDMQLELLSKLKPSTSGQLIKCSYSYDIQCEIDYAPDIHCTMPVLLYAPQPPPQFMLQQPW